MQLTDDEIKEIADWFSMLPNSVQVTQFARAIESALRAQADARPVGFIEQWELDQLKNGCVARVFPTKDEPHDVAVYTHPEASAPGLSDEARKLIQYAAEFIGGAVNYGQNAPDEPPGPVSQWDYDAHYLAQGLQALLTRASAATVAEPRKYPLAQGYQSYGDGGGCEQAEPMTEPGEYLPRVESDQIWHPINTAPWSDDLIWVRKGDVVGGPKRIQHDDADEWDYWTPCVAPPFAQPIKAAQQQAESQLIYQEQVGNGLWQDVSKELHDAIKDGRVRGAVRTVRVTQQAEPKCATCNGTGMVADGEITGSGGVEFESGPIKCVTDCPCCIGKQQAEPGADERAAFEKDARRWDFDLSACNGVYSASETHRAWCMWQVASKGKTHAILNSDKISEAYSLLSGLITGEGLPPALDDVALDIHNWLCKPVSKLKNVIDSASPKTSFDVWAENPYTKKLQKSIAEDYLPRDAAQSGQRAGAAEDARDAARYRWLRDSHPADESVWVAMGNPLTGISCWRHEKLDRVIDAAIAAPTQQQEGV